MLTEICQYLRNWFARDILLGDFIISGNVLTYEDGGTLPLINSQYFRIVGSLLNDGVHKYGDVKDVLKDEPKFSGSVWMMAVPPTVIELSEDIDNWVQANTDAINSPYQSESFGGYSYQKGSGGGSINGNSITWQSQFASRLAPWRKI